MIFFFQDKDQRSMDMETAKAMLQLLLGKHWSLYTQFSQFLDQSKYKVINKDQWCNILEFSRTIFNDLSNYDVDGACESIFFFIVICILIKNILLYLYFFRASNVRWICRVVESDESKDWYKLKQKCLLKLQCEYFLRTLRNCQRRTKNCRSTLYIYFIYSSSVENTSGSLCLKLHSSCN